MKPEHGLDLLSQAIALTQAGSDHDLVHMAVRRSIHQGVMYYDATICIWHLALFYARPGAGTRTGQLDTKVVDRKQLVASMGKYPELVRVTGITPNPPGAYMWHRSAGQCSACARKRNTTRSLGRYGPKEKDPKWLMVRAAEKEWNDGQATATA